MENISQAQAQANAVKLITICETWQKIKPFAGLIHTLLFFSKKARAAFDTLVDVADGICPSEQ